ncbi:MAG: DUF4386 domain-containing protein [Marinilabiliaceae bacterium]|nr:DUF4386 domain-containing protein [Marinilabiliaceae bacterium]
MNKLNEMKENKRTARIAGFWYLVLAIGAGYTWFYINKTFVPENALLTVQNILASETQYVVTILFSIVGQIGFMFLALTLYRLFKNVNQTQARLLLTLVSISIAISFVNIIFQTGALVFLNRANYFTAFSTEQIYELTTMFLHLNIFGVYVVTIFWGLWLFPFAYLVYKSNFFPKIIAYLLVFSGICYMLASLSFIISPEIHKTLESYLSLPQALGEVTVLLWLLIKGVSTPKEVC